MLPDWQEALRRYLEARDRLTEAEAEDNCSCDVDNFHECAWCKQRQELGHTMDTQLTLWGDTWAVMLAAQYPALLGGKPCVAPK